MSEDSIKRMWRAGSFATPPSLERLRGTVGGFDRMIRRRNRIEHGAGALVIGVFALVGLAAPEPLVKLACALIVAGTVFLLWQLRRRARAEATPGAEGALPLLAHHRAQLVRQRDVLNSVVWWYLLPLLPGQLLFFHAVGGSSVRGFAMMAGVLALFGGIWWLNADAARKLGREIAELDALAE